MTSLRMWWSSQSSRLVGRVFHIFIHAKLYFAIILWGENFIYDTDGSLSNKLRRSKHK